MIVFRPILGRSWAVIAMLLATASLKAQSSPEQAKTLTDATFAFSTDIHVSFDGISDLEGVAQQNQNLAYAQTEMVPSQNGPICETWVKDLCNQISQVQKLNALPLNSWMSSGFGQNGITRSLAGAGMPINTPQGVIIGGDLTDCGGGEFGSSGCPLYGNENLAATEYPLLGVFCTNNSPATWIICNPTLNTDSEQWQAFISVYDNSNPSPMDFSHNLYLTGLQEPNTRLNYPIYPGLGNHDIDSGTDEIKNYIATWNPSANGAKKVTDSDPDSTSYSWDWGHLHIVNVGVFPGSDNSVDGENNYQFSQAALNWLATDLALFAGDGRPVIIASHFGFDPKSLGSMWWGPSSARSQAILALWPVLKQYNVIGYFHGHNHWKGWWYQFPNSSNTSEGGPAVGYDIFNSGPGFAQDFVVSHVTDSYMDVMFTQENSQASGSSVAFGRPFTKILSKPPVVTGAYQTEGGQDIAASLTVNGTTYLVTGLNVPYASLYNVQKVSSSGQPETVCTGNLGLTDLIQGVTTYVASDGSGHVLMNLTDKLADFRLNRNSCLTPDWSSNVKNAQAITILNVSGKSYLLVDASGLWFQLYTIGANGLELTAQSNPLPPMVDKQICLPVQFSDAAAGKRWRQWSNCQPAKQEQYRVVPAGNQSSLMSSRPAR